jgi:hypothetical protein
VGDADWLTIDGLASTIMVYPVLPHQRQRVQQDERGVLSL